MALLAVVLAALTYLPGIGEQEWVGTEDFRARIAAETAERGDWVVPSFYGSPILTKPPLYYAALAGTLRLAGGHGPGEARLLSLAALAAVAAMIAYAGARAGGARCGVVAACGYLLALNSIKNGVNAEIDPLYALFAVAALLGGWRGLRTGRTAWALAAGAALGLAGLTKGWAVLPVVAAAAAGAWQLRVRPRPRFLVAAALPALAGLLAWPLALACLDPARTAGAVRENDGFFTGWDGAAVIDTLLFPFALVVASLPFSLAALHRLRSSGRAPLDRYLVVVVLAFLIAPLPSAPKATRYLLPCLPLLVLAGALRLERLAATHRFSRGVALAAVIVAAAALPAVRGSLDLGGALALGALALAGSAGWFLAPRRPALALVLLLLPARALFTQVYLPAWEADGQAVAPAVEELRRLTDGAESLAVVRTESPRLTDPLQLDTRFFWDPADLRAELAAGQRFDAVLMGIKRQDIGIPGYVQTGTLVFEGKSLRVLKPAD